MKEIYEYSNGIPRLINLACHNALINGLVFDAKKISRTIASEAIDELLHNTMRKLPSRRLAKSQEEEKVAAISFLKGIMDGKTI